LYVKQIVYLHKKGDRRTMRREIQMTEDGSHTVRLVELEECYHSTHGAIQESMHIFIRTGLFRFLPAGAIPLKPRVHVLEIGFGTGLNAFLTLLEAEKHNTPIHYTSLELHPLTEEEALPLNYPEALGKHDDDPFRKKRQSFEQLHRSPWEKTSPITPHFTLHKIKADFTGYNLPGLYDVIHFDAFSPEKQPEMWTEAGFRKIYNHATAGAVLTTYCAKGNVRRALQAAGFTVERLPGPPGKREILCATKP
jgi:tRNA U34 5-methylaminomethyl-2-thiouridine-forming methyltransferase MnmC